MESFDMNAALKGSEQADSISYGDLEMEAAVENIKEEAARFDNITLVSGDSIDMSVEAYVEKNFGVEGIKRYKLAKHTLPRLNLSLSDDVLLMLACSTPAKVVIATAGAGKTTCLHLTLIVSKLLDSIRETPVLQYLKVADSEYTLPVILYLNYNEHNVKPIQERHAYLCGRVNTFMKQQIDPRIESSTMHSFCYRWVDVFLREYLAGQIDVTPELKKSLKGYKDLKIVSENDKRNVWEAIIRPRWKKYYFEETPGISFEVMEALYNYKAESIIEWEQFFETAKFVDTELNPEFVQSCIEKYESMKSAMGLTDFTDYLILMIKIFKNVPSFKERIKRRYKIIVADENQDFTALMNELLLELHDPEHNELIAVGDPDQTLYAFKGVAPDNMVKLYERLDKVTLLGLDTNYRCPDRIVDSAKAILNLNRLRFKKPIKTVKTGGALIKHPRDSSVPQHVDILNALERLGREHYADTVITYRNNSSALVLNEELYYAGIPFKVIDSRRPFNNKVFRNIESAIKALLVKHDRVLNLELFRLLPVTREYWSKILEDNYKERRSHLHDLVIPSNCPHGTLEALKTLVAISTIVETSPCSEYINSLFKLYRRYNFDFLLKQSGNVPGERDYWKLTLERTARFFGRPFTFDYLQNELSARNVDSVDGVTLSTFHRLKGLEFDYVFAVDFVDSVFPDYATIEQRYTANTALREKESENRLCYVLITRAVKEFHMFYLDSNPSVYIDIMCGESVGEKLESDSIKELTLGTVSSAGKSFGSQLDFINKLTQGRR